MTWLVEFQDRFPNFGRNLRDFNHITSLFSLTVFLIFFSGNTGKLISLNSLNIEQKLRDNPLD